MSTGSRELIATHEPTVIAILVFDARVVEDGESDRCLPDPPPAPMRAMGWKFSAIPITLSMRS